MIITKVKPSFYIGLVTAAWGLVSLCQAFTRNFAGLFICRIVLGLVEGPFLPGVFFLMSCWYKRSELPPRIAFLYGANMLASAFGGLIAAGIVARMEGKLGRPAWEWLFIIEGSMTIAMALFVIPFIPDYPGSTTRWWIKQDHQLLAGWRLRNENAGIVDDDPESLLWGVKQAFLDPKLYMFIMLQMSLLTAQSFNNFFPSIVGTLGYNETITLLLTAPPYFFAFLCSICISFHGARVNERGLHIAVPLAFALLGNLLAMFTPSLGARYFSMFLMTAGSYSPYNLVVSWLSSTLPRPKSKRAAAFAIVNLMGAGVAHFYTSYMFPDSQKPRYYAGGGVMSGACLVYIKPNNILVNYEESPEGQETVKTVQISDLEDTVIVPAGKWLRGPLCGNAIWRSPESWCRSRQNQASDVFSFAITEDDLCHGDLRQPFRHWDYVEPDLRDIVGKMTSLDPTKRITAREALQHRWFYEYW
ncbi:hypothetical protein N8T08_008002 [Aspergillus melleus]|uniref:Uncharacterized protein n=1 Tax=Aspergillus melleus TaxID=138277 RepID=A0ACC3AX49_9EURO|nr:hypothetical protein N8T08_008002 [Aspergillus melleus]